MKYRYAIILKWFIRFESKKIEKKTLKPFLAEVPVICILVVSVRARVLMVFRYLEAKVEGAQVFYIFKPKRKYIVYNIWQIYCTSCTFFCSIFRSQK